jgi:hypothetical protein
MTKLSKFNISRRIYYIWGNYIGFYSTPSTNTKEIRIHYTYVPTDLSSDTDNMAISDDFKDAVAFGAALKACKKKLRAKDPEKYILLQRVLEKDYFVEKERVIAIGAKKDGEAFATMDYVDY